MPLQRGEQPSGPRSPAAPRGHATASRLGRNRSPQPTAMAASMPTTKPNPGGQQAAKDCPTDTDANGGGDPPGQGPGPGGPLGRPQPPPPRVGGAAGPTHAGPNPHGHHWLIGAGAGQQLV